MLARRTQTNEPARCATLLPALALLPQPLALIEVGASAGLTLLADRYSYDYGSRQLAGTDPCAPVLSCRPLGPVPIPAQVPEVAWRAGLDLNPLDVTDDDDVRWLECLVWPGETGRRERLAAAIETARRDPPPVHRGDLLTDLVALARQAPPGATLVIYHSAVLAYVAPEQPRPLRRRRSRRSTPPGSPTRAPASFPESPYRNATATTSCSCGTEPQSSPSPTPTAPGSSGCPRRVATIPWASLRDREDFCYREDFSLA